MTITKTKLKIIGVFLISTILFNCKKIVKNDISIIYSEKPTGNLLYNGKKELVKVIEINGDTVFFKTNVPVGGGNRFMYALLNKEDKKNLKERYSALNKIRFDSIYKDSYTVDYEYSISINNKNIYICSKSYPNEISSLIEFIKELSKSGLAFKEIKIDESYKEISILRMDNNSLSSIESYLIWKKMTFSSERVIKKDIETNLSNYVLLTTGYPPSFNGNKVENLIKTDLYYFYNLNDEFYTFR